MNTGLPKPHSIIDQTISGNIKYDDSNKRYILPALNISNNFATLDYDAHIITKIDFTINHVFKSMTVQELNTLHTICELERTQLLTILAMSVKNPQLAGFLLTGNRSNFLYVEGSTAYNILPNLTIVNNKFHFLIHPFSNTKNILITSSYQKIHK